MENLFFVYGTLKGGYGNNYLLGDSEFIGTAHTIDTYNLYNHGFPIASKNENGAQVLGEVYKVISPNVIQSLDALEGNGRWYTRAKRKVVVDGKEEEAWIYEINKEMNSPLCPTKDGKFIWGGRY